MLGNCLIIGLDYGTTHTGVAFSETSDNSLLDKHIEVIMDWPTGRKCTTIEKVPSEIAYTPKGTKWGACIPDGEQRHMWTKLDLDRSNHCTQVGEAAKILSEMTLHGSNPARQPVTVVADFLRQVKGHLVTNLDTQYGPQLWRTLPVTLVITVPAVWSDAAKFRTMEAVSKGGFNTMEFPRLKKTITITEPEAAVLHTMMSFNGSVQGDRFSVGHGFIVCDMGGGTVDLVSYRVANLEPTALEEATIGNGDQCGSSFVDQAFIRLLERRMRPADFYKLAGCRTEDISRTSLPPDLSKMVRHFAIDAKAVFTGKEVSFVDFPRVLRCIEDDEERGIDGGTFIIAIDEMRELFDCALHRTRELLLDQIQQARRNSVPLKCVILVGGFSTSPFVLSEIKAFAQSHGLEVIRPAFPTSAVVRGAVAKGIEGNSCPRIRNRKCRRSYGTDCMTPFSAGIHKIADKIVCEYTDTHYATHQMKWIVKKGEDLSTSSNCHGKFPMFQKFWPHTKRVFTLDLLATDADKAPYRSKNNDVYTVATLRVNVEDVPQRLFRTAFSPSGGMYYKLFFDVELSVQSALEFSVSVNGKKYGSVTAKYT